MNWSNASLCCFYQVKALSEDFLFHAPFTPCYADCTMWATPKSLLVLPLESFLRNWQQNNNGQIFTPVTSAYIYCSSDVFSIVIWVQTRSKSGLNGLNADFLAISASLGKNPVALCQSAKPL